MGSPLAILLVGFLVLVLLLAPGAAIHFFSIGYFGKWSKNQTNACTRCGYDLSGLPPDARCPECGLKRTLRWVVDRRFTMIGFAIVALWMVLLLGGMFVVIWMAVTGR